MKKLEICCYSAEDAAIAQHAGADRIELCSGRSDGGLTPSYGELLQAKAHCQLPIHPIVRPRGGDFHYSEFELNTMLSDITLIKELGFSGVVLGALATDGTLDMAIMKKFIQAAGSLSITFHRAFDVCKDPINTLKQLSDLGIDRVLTSGQQANAEQGLDLLIELNQLTSNTIIMPGSGVRLNNLAKFIAAGFNEVHSSAALSSPSLMQYHNTAVSMSSQQQANEYCNYHVDANMVTAMKAIMLQGH